MPIPAPTKAIRRCTEVTTGGGFRKYRCLQELLAKQSCAGWRPARMYTTPKSTKTQSSVIACPVCGSDTVKRTGRFGSFWGCSRYPGCHGTQPFKIDQAGQPCRHCQTPVVHQTHTKPPKPKHGGSWRSASGGSYFEWWFRCPGCKAIYLVEAARRFFDATDTAKPSSAPGCSPDWVTRGPAILPWQ